MINFNKNMELLAPAGNLDILKEVAAAGADAVYCGGKQYNMRMLRPHFNLEREELKTASDWLHERNKKLYVTVNNLYFPEDITGLVDYLQFLSNIAVDAIIVQDLALIPLIRKLNLDIPMHASVQMGINNLAAVNYLYEQGVKRVILSKNLSLQEISFINQHTSMELEYFVHGDMCISHTGACYMSSFLSGMSSNQGLCVKPCRWPYRLEGDAVVQNIAKEQFFLAHKDLCLYEDIAALSHAGIISLKIEGRMRDAEYLSKLVRAYRQKLDTGISENIKELQIRDTTQAGLYRKTTLQDVGLSGEKEPPFPTYVRKVEKITADVSTTRSTESSSPIELSVKVASPKVLQQLNLAGIDNLIIDTTLFRQYLTKPDLKSAWTDILADINASRAVKQIFLETPRIMIQKEFEYNIDEIISLARIVGTNSFIVNDLGSLAFLNMTEGATVWAGYGLNVGNHEAADWLGRQGISRVVASLEMGLTEILRLAANTEVELEIMVQGMLPGIITDVCIPAGSVSLETDEASCHQQCLKADYFLVDAESQKYRILNDYRCRNHITAPLDLGAAAAIDNLRRAHIASVRIEGQNYSAEILEKIIKIYNNEIKGQGRNGQDELLRLFSQGLTGGKLLMTEQL